MNRSIVKNAFFAGFLATAATFGAPDPAGAEVLRGTKFVFVMQGNTVSGRTEKGVAFNVYFQTGGIVVYEDQAGVRDNGTWHQDPQDRICVKWKTLNPGRMRCFVVTMQGRSVSFKAPDVKHKTFLRGSIAETFLTPRKKAN